MTKRLNADAIVNMTLPVDAIEPHPQNYNQHPDEQISQLAASQVEFGQYRSVVVWQRPGGKYVQVAGHGYLEAAKGEGLTQVRCDVLPDDTPAETIKAIMVADNLHAQNSSPDDEMLAELLQEQVNAGFDLASLGTDDEALRQMLEALGDGYAGGGGESEDGGDDFDTTPEEGPTRTQVGEIWQLGKHRLLVSDCANPENIKRLMQDKKADMVFTDPPYGMHLDTQFSSMHKANSFGPGGKNYAPVKGDDKPFDPNVFLSQFDYCKEQFWWGADYYRDKIPMGGSWVVWDKRDSEMNLDALIGSAFELCWSRQLHKREIARIVWAGHHGMGKPGDTKSRVHPTQKPVGLVGWFFERWGNVDDLVVDFYLGSGTTLIACERNGRTCYGCEIEPRYADVIISRYESETGQTAQLIERIEEVVNV